jgi:hypothetical protein
VSPRTTVTERRRQHQPVRAHDEPRVLDRHLQGQLSRLRAQSHRRALHILLQGATTYNGYPTAEVNTEKGCTKLGIQFLKNGVITRGVLIDIPRLKNLPYLEPGTPVFVEDLEAWEKKTGIKIGSGDAIFLRTGRWARREKLGAWNVGRSGPATTRRWCRGSRHTRRRVRRQRRCAGCDAVGRRASSCRCTRCSSRLRINLLDNQDLKRSPKWRRS